MARQSGLGKGLGALLPNRPEEPNGKAPTVTTESTSALRDVPVSSVKANKYQPRNKFDAEQLDSLAASIKQLGVLQPLLVREAGSGKYELIAGERRLRASKQAGLTTVPVIVREANDTAALEEALVENLHRQDLNALEEAAAYKQLIDDFGITHETVAKRVGKSRASVTNMLRLLTLPANIQKKIVDGSISAGHARALLGTSDTAFQDSLVKRITTEGLSVRETEQAVRMREELGSAAIDLTAVEASSSRAGSSPRVRPAALLELETLLGDFLDTRVNIEMSSKRGKIAIEFSTLEDLERIYKVMTKSKVKAS